MAWYRTGTLSLTNNGTGVTGTGSKFKLGAQAGDMLSVNSVIYEIATVGSDTSITLATPYKGATASGVTDWAITQTQSLTLAQNKEVAQLIIDVADMKTSFGPLRAGADSFAELIDARVDDAELAALDAEASAASALASKNTAVTNAAISTTNKDATAADVVTTNASKVAAAASATSADGSKIAAATSADASETARAAAVIAKTAAETAKGQVDTTKGQIDTTKGQIDTIKSQIDTAKVAVDTAKAAVDTAKITTETKAGEAAASAASALTSKNASATSETNAATSATSASESATGAETARAAAVVAKNATDTTKGQIDTIKGQIDTQKAAVDTKAGEAATSATNANTSKLASEAAKVASETARDGSVTARTAAEAARDVAVTAKNAAETAKADTDTALASTLAAKLATEAARDTTLTAFHEFNDKYLGRRAVAPTTDDDGDPLVEGALYFDTVENVMKVWEGSYWVAAYVTGTGFALVGHTHELADINGLTAALASKADAGHLHAIADITGLQAAIDARQPLNARLTDLAALTYTSNGSKALRVNAGATALELFALAAIATSGSAADLSTGTLPAARLPAMTGDVTSPAGSTVTTLATVNSNTGSFGSATAVPVITVDGKGRITGASTANIIGITDSNKGDITVASSGASWSVNPNAITLAKMAQTPTATFLGRSTASTGNVEAMTAAQATALIVPASTTTQGAMSAADKVKLNGIATGATANTGTVTSVSVATANGVSGTVANAGTTPAITLTLGAITPSSVSATGTISASNFSGTHSGASSGTNTGDQTITLTGDATGSGTGSFAVTLAASGATAGTYKSVTVDAKGRVTAGSNPATAISDVTGLQTALDAKQATLVSGTNIKTVGGTSILGPGDITVATSFAALTGKPTTLSGYGITDAQPLNARLTDLAALTYASNGSKALRVNAGATALELFALAAIATSGSAADLSTGTLPAARLPAMTGDVTRPVGSSASTLANSGVSAGTYKSVTVDAKGRVTAGSNPTTLAGYGITDGVRKYATSIGNGSATSYTVTHNLNTWDVVISIRQNSDGQMIIADWVTTSVNAITITYGAGKAPATNGHAVVVIG